MNKQKERVIILDLDRTLVNSDERTSKHTLPNGKLNFKTLHEGILELDKIDDKMDSLSYYLRKNTFTYTKIIILSGRNTNALDETYLFLQDNSQNDIKKEDIYLRKTDDYRPNHEYKKEVLQKLMKEYNILWYIDDDISCCAEANKLGIPTLCYMSPHKLDDYTKDNIKRYVNKEFE